MSNGRGLAGGIVCSLVTPFDEQGRADLAALSRLIDFQIERGIHGLFLLGTAGEGVLLPIEERIALADHALGHVAGRVPVAIHCGAPDTATAAHLAEHAASAGADAIAMVSPFYFSYGDAPVYEHFSTIAARLPDIDVYLYDNAERVGYSMSVGVICRLVADVPNIKGIKDTGDTIARVTRYLASAVDIEVYTGNNLIVYPALVVGAVGSVSALASVAPELFVAIFDAFRSGDSDAARALQLTAAHLQSCLDGLPYIGSIKQLLETRGLSGGLTRAPVPNARRHATELRARVEGYEDVSPWMEPVSA